MLVEGTLPTGPVITRRPGGLFRWQEHPTVPPPNAGGPGPGMPGPTPYPTGGNLIPLNPRPTGGNLVPVVNPRPTGGNLVPLNHRGGFMRQSRPRFVSPSWSMGGLRSSRRSGLTRFVF